MVEEARHLLLAGAWGTEREPPTRAGAEPGWHQPPHVRDPTETRHRLAEQVAVGADAIVAPTYRTSRPALARFGEARRAREWTGAALALAREAVEVGREERTGNGDIIICGSIPPFDQFSGEEADAEDFRAHAETIAEAGADVLLVEQMGSVAAARAATLAAASTGMPVWSGVALSPDGTRLESGESLVDWVEVVDPADPAQLLVYGTAATAARQGLAQLKRLASRPVGALLEAAPADEDGQALLDLGVSVMGLFSGATAAVLRPLRQVIDTHGEARAAVDIAVRAALQEWLHRAASWAAGGPALWLGHAPELELPSGFDWTIAPQSDLARLPERRYRLAVLEDLPDLSQFPRQLVRVLDSGGVMLVPAELAERVDGASRVLDMSDDPGLAILRRE